MDNNCLDLIYPAPDANTPDDGERIPVGVSSCLLGHKVRYDGGHKHDRYVTDALGRYLDFHPLCPEMECGMGAPREPIRLVGDPESPRLVGRESGHDFTQQMRSWGEKRLQELQGLGLCGHIFKSRSPSSGMARIPVYQANGHALYTGVGIWARMFMDRFPLLPVEDEGRLNDPKLRENFIVRLFVFKRWRDMLRDNRSVGGLVHFHTRHKLLLMAHSPKHYKEMGAYVAGAKSMPLDEALCGYVAMLSRALRQIATRGKHVNTMGHVAGYFKKQLAPDEKQELRELMDRYHDGQLPLIVPITLLNHYARKYGESYLADQHYLAPHPAELALRNHV